MKDRNMEDSEALVTLTADIVSAHVSNNSVAIADIPQLIRSVHEALAGLGTKTEPEAEPQQPAVSIRASVKPDHIVCLEDGKKMTMLRRHLRTEHDMTPDEYRAKWKLPADYPMTAPNYSERRRVLAKEIGLGSKGRGGGRKPAPRGRAKAK
jgi:predicted transcriptional regulator